MTIPLARPDAVAMRVLDIVARRFAVTLPELRTSGRRRVCAARQIAMYAVREATGMSYPELAGLFDRDHSTVMSGVKRVRAVPALLGHAEAVAVELPGWAPGLPPSPSTFMVVAVTCDYGRPRLVQRTESTCS